MNKNVLVILDYGHGGINPSTGEYVTKGKRSPNWSSGDHPVHNKNILYEGESNREIGKILEEKLQSLGINYAVVNASWKDMPLLDRCEIANSNGYTGKSFLISIHSNAGGGTSVEVFTSPGDTPADPMASLSVEVFKDVFPEYADKIRTDYRDGDADKEARFTMLTDTNMPAFLPEAFFMDQEKECKEILMTQEGKQRIADWHFKTIVRILNELY